MRKQISDMILSGVSLRQIAKSVTPTVSPMALQRYKAAVLTPALQKVALAKAAEAKTVQTIAEVAPHLERIAKRQADIDAAIANAPAREVAALASADFKGIELAMRATGLLDSGAGHHTTINAQQVVLMPLATGAQPDPAAPGVIDVTPEK